MRRLFDEATATAITPDGSNRYVLSIPATTVAGVYSIAVLVNGNGPQSPSKLTPKTSLSQSQARTRGATPSVQATRPTQFASSGGPSSNKTPPTCPPKHSWPP